MADLLALWRWAQDRPEHVALIAPDGTPVTAGALLEASNRLVHGFRDLGLGHGDTVAVALPNGTVMFEVFLAALQSGLAITPGVPKSSRLLQMVRKQLKPFMPPDDAEGPNEEELEILQRWIEEGAKGPDGDLPIKRSLRTPKIASSFASHESRRPRACDQGC